MAADDGLSDRELGMDRPIARRDFLNGLAVGIGALGALSPKELLRAGILDSAPADEYPPAKTGLRGAHEGAFETAHRLRDGNIPAEWSQPAESGESYDLVVVGAGISGLSAAYFYRQAAGPNARILVLDNHDDFGGHARRNEFTVGARTLIGYAGTQSIDTPSRYSRVSQRLLRELGIDTRAFEKLYDQNFFEGEGLGEAVFFDRETFGVDRLVMKPEDEDPAAFLARTPLAEPVKKDIARLMVERVDYLAGMSQRDKKALLAKTSYGDFLVKHAKASPRVLPYFQKWTHDYYGVGIDAVPAADCQKFGFPCFEALGLDNTHGPGLGRTAMLHESREPYIFHFPDGNASIARLLVRSLIPGTIPGRTMYDIVGARVAYDRLDSAAQKVRLRLSSTVVRAQNVKGGVDLVYVQGGKAVRVSARRCVLACWNGIIPHLAPELSDAQKAALRYGVKVPLLYTNVALRNWKALEKLNVHGVFAPGSYFSDSAMDFPVSMGGYRYPKTSAEPVVLAMHRAPCKPGLPAREQQRLGRAELLGTTYATLERKVREQLARTFVGGGFDPARDIAAITVNRWPHGYAYEYNSMWDPAWKPGQSPCEIGRKGFGNIAIANSDAAAYAYTDAAIDQAWRAVDELSRSAHGEKPKAKATGSGA